MRLVHLSSNVLNSSFVMQQEQLSLLTNQAIGSQKFDEMIEQAYQYSRTYLSSQVNLILSYIIAFIKIFYVG